jgi:hypothetical protein
VHQELEEKIENLKKTIGAGSKLETIGNYPKTPKISLENFIYARKKF